MSAERTGLAVLFRSVFLRALEFDSSCNRNDLFNLVHMMNPREYDEKSWLGERVVQLRKGEWGVIYSEYSYKFSFQRSVFMFCLIYFS